MLYSAKGNTHIIKKVNKQIKEMTYICLTVLYTDISLFMENCTYFPNSLWIWVHIMIKHFIEFASGRMVLEDPLLLSTAYLSISIG